MLSALVSSLSPLRGRPWKRVLCPPWFLEITNSLQVLSTFEKQISTHSSHPTPGENYQISPPCPRRGGDGSLARQAMTKLDMSRSLGRYLLKIICTWHCTLRGSGLLSRIMSSTSSRQGTLTVLRGNTNTALTLSPPRVINLQFPL